MLIPVYIKHMVLLTDKWKDSYISLLNENYNYLKLMYGVIIALQK